MFANAKVFNKTAGTLLTVSDNIITKKIISAEEREKSLDKMALLALEGVIRILTALPLSGQAPTRRAQRKV